MSVKDQDKDQEVRGQGKVQIVFIGSGGGGLKFGDSCVIVRKDSVLSPGGMCNILVNYGGATENFPITVYYPSQTGPTAPLTIDANGINAILPTSLEDLHINKIPGFVLSRNLPIDLIVPSDNFKDEFWNKIKNIDPANHLINTFETYFNKKLITQVEDIYDDIGINYFLGMADNSFEVMFDDRISYSGTNLNEIEFSQGKFQA